MKFSDVRIGVRLGAAFGLLLLFLAAFGAAGLTAMARTEARLDRLVAHNEAQTARATAMSAAFRDIMGAVGIIVQSADEGIQKDFKAKLAAARERYGAAKKGFADAADDRERSLIERLDAALKSAVPTSNKVMALVAEGNLKAASEAMVRENEPAGRALIAITDEIVRHEQDSAAAAAAASRAEYELARQAMMAGGLLVIAAGVLAAWLCTRSITHPLRRAVQVAERVATGDLTATIDAPSHDETGRLLAALGAMTQELAQLAGGVRTGAHAISDAAGQIAAGNQDLSQRTEEQASSIQETAASMEELTSTVRQNADNAQQANSLAQEASEVALRGGSVVDQVIETMSGINQASGKIVDIIAVIDGIAFQTNILALNAAVEAARAGEQGRGFAVVAAEVRTLAQRSAAAAREVKALIEDSVAKVGAGTELVGRAGETMHQVESSIQRVTALMGNIAAASHEQTRGIQQVNQAINQMDQVTQQNAALVEEAAAAAHSMREQTAALLESASVFRIADEPGAGGPQPAPAVAPRPRAARPQAAVRIAAPVLKHAKPVRQVRSPALAGAGSVDAWTEF